MFLLFLAFSSFGYCGYGERQPFDFADTASYASVVVQGKILHMRGTDLPVVYGSEHGSMKWIEVEEVLAADRLYVHRDGTLEMPKLILLNDPGIPRNLAIPYECPSIFFLRPIFGYEQFVQSSREKVWKMVEEYDVDPKFIFEVTDNRYGAFSLLSEKEFIESRLSRDPKFPQALLDRFLPTYRQGLEDRQEAWGLNDSKDVVAFVRKALLPFFEQMDEEWFISEASKLEEGEPLRRVAESLKSRRTEEEESGEEDSVPKPLDKENFTKSGHLLRWVRVPFVAGSVLSNENLTSGFPSFEENAEDVSQGEGEGTAGTASEEAQVAEDSAD